jgi:hypothetical protein
VSQKKDAPEAFREMAEKGTMQAKETYDKIDAATTEAADPIKHSYLIIEFAHANTNTALDYVQKLSGMKSPTALVELWVETLTEQSKQLAALGQKVTDDR